MVLGKFRLVLLPCGEVVMFRHQLLFGLWFPRPKGRQVLIVKKSKLKRWLFALLWTRDFALRNLGRLSLQRPGSEVRKWILSLVPECHGQLLDTWNWELQPGCAGPNSVVRGLCRVKKGAWVGSLLHCSGRNFAGLRCFLDPLDWSVTPDDSFGKQPFISWVERRAGELDHEYASRVVGLATTGGVARGWRQLGLRSSQPLGFPAPGFPFVWLPSHISVWICDFPHTS